MEAEQLREAPGNVVSGMLSRLADGQSQIRIALPAGGKSRLVFHKLAKVIYCGPSLCVNLKYPIQHFGRTSHSL
jgi:hypothetical protein